jgi:hypothetical protein
MRFFHFIAICSRDRLMPELPEVETVKLALIPALQGRAVLSAFVGRKDLRWPLPENLAERLTWTPIYPSCAARQICDDDA